MATFDDDSKDTWRFIRKDFRFDDGQQVVPGQTYVLPKQQIRDSHQYACPRMIDAIQFAEGPVACSVRLDGCKVEGEKLIYAERMHVYAVVDASDALKQACEYMRWSIEGFTGWDYDWLYRSFMDDLFLPRTAYRMTRLATIVWAAHRAEELTPEVATNHYSRKIEQWVRGSMAKRGLTKGHR